MEANQNTSHPLTLAGLGAAPFAFLGMTKEVYQACPGAPSQPGGTCHACGTAIVYVYRVRSACGRVSSLGCDCIQKMHPALWAAVLEDRREARRLAREAAFRAASERNALSNAARKASQAERNAVNLAMVLEGLHVALESQLSGYDRNRLETACRELEEGSRDGLTAWEWASLARCYLAASLPPSVHIGTVGARLRGLRVRYEGGPTVGIDSQWGPSVMGKFRIVSVPQAGAALVWKTGYHPCKVGTVATLTGTVKRHDSYDGIDQTWLSRCKVTDEDESGCVDERANGSFR